MRLSCTFSNSKSVASAVIPSPLRGEGQGEGWQVSVAGSPLAKLTALRASPPHLNGEEVPILTLQPDILNTKNLNI